MIELINKESKPVGIGESVVFENKTDCSFDVKTGIIFYKSGLYEVSILDNRTTISKVMDISKVMERKKGQWIYHVDDFFPSESTQECSVCHEHELMTLHNEKYCPNCGARMESER